MTRRKLIWLQTRPWQSSVFYTNLSPITNWLSNRCVFNPNENQTKGRRPDQPIGYQCDWFKAEPSAHVPDTPSCVQILEIRRQPTEGDIRDERGKESRQSTHGRFWTKLTIDIALVDVGKNWKEDDEGCEKLRIKNAEVCYDYVLLALREDCVFLWLCRLHSTGR